MNERLIRSATLFVLLLCGVLPAWSQTLTVSNDTSFCPPDSVQLHATVSGTSASTNNYTISSIPYAPLPTTGATPIIGNVDDVVSQAVPIGFTFEFFCNSYTNFYVCSNGWIGFTPQPGFNTWGANFNSDPIPSTVLNIPKNCIFGPWQDWDPSVPGGIITYQTQGVAPNRRLVVTFTTVPLFACNAFNGTFQIVLHETTNIIENHITSKPQGGAGGTWCNWGGGQAVQGLHNLTGTVAVINAGRNDTQWSTSNESIRYTPSLINWSVGGTVVGIGDSLFVSPTTATYYTASITLCNGSTISDSVLVTPSCIDPLIDSLNVNCFGDSTGYVMAQDTSSNGQGPWDFVWEDANGNTISTSTVAVGGDTVFNLPAGLYTVTITDANNQIAWGQVSITSPPEIILSDTNISGVSCYGGPTCDGSGQIVATGGTPGYTYLWFDNTTNSVNNSLCAGNNFVTVTDNNGCTKTDTVFVPQPDSIIASATGDTLLCVSNSHTISASAIGGTPGYNYSWSNGMTGSSITISPISSPTTYIVTISDTNNCPGDTASVTILLRDSLSITSITTADDTICIGDSTALTAAAIGGDNNYTFTWSGGAGVGNPKNVGPSISTLYTVTVSDGCGSPPVTANVFVQVGGYSPILVTTFPFPVDTICPGDTANIGAFATGGFGNYTFSWNQGLGNGTNFQVSPTTTTGYIVTVTDQCNTPAAIGGATIQVGGYPAIQPVMNPSDTDTICLGEFILLNAGAGGGYQAGGYNYSWNLGLGNDNDVFVSPTGLTTYIVTITDNCLTPAAVDSVTIDVGNFAALDFGVDIDSACVPETFNFQIIDSIIPEYTYEWTINDEDPFKSDTNPSIHIVDPGCYDIKVQVTTDLGCVTTLRKPCMVQTFGPPNAQIGLFPRHPTYNSSVIHFRDETWGSVSRFWTLGDGFTSDQASFSHLFDSIKWYPIEMVAINEFGCKDTAYDSLYVKFESSFFVPTSFTPNGDGLNDEFGPIGLGISVEDYEMIIYNRWGQVIFQTNDPTAKWDGTHTNGDESVQLGVYAYLIRYKEFSGLQKEVMGSVTVSRNHER